MSAVQLTVTTQGLAETQAQMSRLRMGLEDRKLLHAAIAKPAADLTRGYLEGLNEHKTAERLGATPTQHYKKAAAGVESGYDEDAASVRIPARTGLRRAFQEMVIVPGSGRKFLAIPDHRRTYGKLARSFPAPLAFKLVGGRHKALVFSGKGDPDYGTVAYWLRPKVTIPQDRGLLPSDDDYRAVARVGVRAFIQATTKDGGVA